MAIAARLSCRLKQRVSLTTWSFFYFLILIFSHQQGGAGFFVIAQRELLLRGIDSSINCGPLCWQILLQRLGQKWFVRSHRATWRLTERDLVAYASLWHLAFVFGCRYERMLLPVILR